MDTKLINDLVNNNKGEDTKLHLLVVGSRKVNDFNLIRNYLDYKLSNYKESKNVEIVSGGANGVDAFAEEYAKENGYELKVFPITKEDWNKFGAKAGWLRNEAMHEYISRFPKRACIAFWDGVSKGTQHSFILAPRYHNELCKVNITENFATELAYDTDLIEEYEEHVTHYGKVKKHVEAPVVVRKAKQEELDRIDRILAKRRENVDELANVVNYIEKGYDALEDYIETRDTMAEEYGKRYKGSKSKACHIVTAEEFPQKAIYTLHYSLNTSIPEELDKFIKISNFLSKAYNEDNYQYMVKTDGCISKIYMLEETTFDKDLSKYTENQLSNYLDKINNILKDNIEKLVFYREKDIYKAFGQSKEMLEAFEK